MQMVFCYTKPGVILSIYDETQYTGAIFPGDVCVLKVKVGQMSNWSKHKPLVGENYWFTDKNLMIVPVSY